MVSCLLRDEFTKINFPLSLLILGCFHNRQNSKHVSFLSVKFKGFLSKFLRCDTHCFWTNYLASCFVQTLDRNSFLHKFSHITIMDYFTDLKKNILKLNILKLPKCESIVELDSIVKLLKFLRTLTNSTRNFKIFPML